MVARKHHGDGSNKFYSNHPSALSNPMMSCKVIEIQAGTKHDASKKQSHLNRKLWIIPILLHSTVQMFSFGEQAWSVGCFQSPNLKRTRDHHYFRWCNIAPTRILPRLYGFPSPFRSTVKIPPEIQSSKVAFSSFSKGSPIEIAASEGLSQSSWLPGT